MEKFNKFLDVNKEEINKEAIQFFQDLGTTIRDVLTLIGQLKDAYKWLDEHGLVPHVEKKPEGAIELPGGGYVKPGSMLEGFIKTLPKAVTPEGGEWSGAPVPPPPTVQPKAPPPPTVPPAAAPAVVPPAAAAPLVNQTVPSPAEPPKTVNGTPITIQPKPVPPTVPAPAAPEPTPAPGWLEDAAEKTKEFWRNFWHSSALEAPTDKGAAQQHLAMNVPASIADALAAKPSIQIPPGLIDQRDEPQQQRRQMAWMQQAQPAAFVDQRAITNQFDVEPEGRRLSEAFGPGGIGGGVGIAEIRGGARLDINVRAPKGTEVNTAREGKLFREISMVRTNQMALASDSPEP